MLFYCQTPSGNFGDDLNPWLWSRLAPEICDPQDKRLFIGIGTLLSNRIPADSIKVVFGAGWAGTRLPKVNSTWKIYCVRGPLTATAMGLPAELALTDPAILVRGLLTGTVEKSYPISFMPHHLSLLRANWPSLCPRVAIHCIDARAGVDEVVLELRRTSLLLAESMHGAIVADALRVPWIPVRLYSQINEFKWRDWMQSLEVEPKIVALKPLFAQSPDFGGWLQHAFKRAVASVGLGKEHWPRLELRASTPEEVDATLNHLADTAKNHPACLSDERTLQRLENQLLQKLATLRDDWVHPNG